jgi:ribosomal protein S18 acetylase RimI-like enzyme
MELQMLLTYAFPFRSPAGKTNTMTRTDDIQYEVPLAPELVDGLSCFWEAIFGGDPDLPREVWLGNETEHHRLRVYLTRHDGDCIGSCATMTSHGLQGLGGLAEVATLPASRGQGIASRLCQQAISDFRAGDGRALFLGTINPAAARVYHRLGWRKLAGAEVMVNVINGESPETFLVDYFRPPGSVSILPADPSTRIPMIPLLHTPHDWQVLDANANLFSTRYHVQQSCMGLYKRYGHCIDRDRGQWFSAWTDDGRLVGLSTVQLTTSGCCNVDGFTHQRFSDCWEPLLQAAMDWGQMQNASIFTARLSVEDEDKRTRFESMGFGKSKPAEPFELGGRSVPSLQLQRD